MQNSKNPFIQLICSALAAIGLGGCSQTVELNTELAPANIVAIAVPYFSAHANNVYAGGQPSEGQLKALKAAGVRHIITLRPDKEINWDEGALVESLGMQYHSFPIAGAGDLNNDKAAEMNTLLKSLGGEKTLIHCASSNRIGALVALHQVEQGVELETAMAEGRRWGMTKLEKVVRNKIEF